MHRCPRSSRPPRALRRSPRAPRSSASTSAPKMYRCDAHTFSIAAITSERIPRYCLCKSSIGTEPGGSLPAHRLTARLRLRPGFGEGCGHRKADCNRRRNEVTAKCPSAQPLVRPYITGETGCFPYKNLEPSSHLELTRLPILIESIRKSMSISCRPL